MLNVLVVDDHRMFREGIVKILDESPDVAVIGTAENGKEALSKMQKKHYDVVFLDINLPDMLGLDVAREIKNKKYQSRIIIVTMYENQVYFEMAIEMDVEGFLYKRCAGDELLEAMRSVVKGERYISALVSGVMMPKIMKGENTEAGRSLKLLTDREWEILKFLAEGYTIREVSGMCGISPKTVENHKKHVMEKLGLRNMVELVKYAIREGVTNA